MFIKRIIRRVLSECALSEQEMICFLKKKGIKLGSGVRLFAPESIIIDTQNPSLLTIGDNVRITRGVKILTHDYSWSVLSGVYGEVLGNIGEVSIGNNVFIGVDAIILKNTTIGDNVIIGAGSVVSGKIESNSVYAGNPCRKIMSIDEFYKKRKENQKEDFLLICERLRIKNPEESKVLLPKEYFQSFYSIGDELPSDYLELIRRTGYYDTIIKKWKK